jgi:hypothetical protein
MYDLIKHIFVSESTNKNLNETGGPGEIHRSVASHW